MTLSAAVWLDWGSQVQNPLGATHFLCPMLNIVKHFPLIIQSQLLWINTLHESCEKIFIMKNTSQLTGIWNPFIYHDYEMIHDIELPFFIFCCQDIDICPPDSAGQLWHHENHTSVPVFTVEMPSSVDMIHMTWPPDHNW